MSSVQSEEFEVALKRLREAYQKKRNATNLYPPLCRPIVDLRVEKVDRYTFWYEDEQANVRCLRIYDEPGTLSGSILRLLQNLPGITGDCEIDGEVLRSLPNAPPPPDSLDDDSEDVSAALQLLLSVPYVGNEHFLKEPKYESEILNLLKCQEGQCPGAPLSPNVIQLLGKSDNGMLVFPKYLTRVETFDPVHPVSMYKSWTLQLLKGAQTLHSLGIVYRDLRIENLLFTQDMQTLLICDLESRWGRRSAPEILHNNSVDAGWSKKSDIWDIGDCIKCMLYGNAPINGAVEWEVPPHFARVVEACQQKIPYERASLHELIHMVESI
ncbi:MAG: hypothetical protein M1821_006312 [Bathelium mastoideum]|nr:MAG: hypothetical protein M1821_006312 [Bathelium mastoideum]